MEGFDCENFLPKKCVGIFYKNNFFSSYRLFVHPAILNISDSENVIFVFVIILANKIHRDIV